MAIPIDSKKIPAHRKFQDIFRKQLIGSLYSILVVSMLTTTRFVAYGTDTILLLSKMESVNKLLNMEVQAPAAFLEGLIALQVLGGISFMICSFVVAHTENIGFNVVLSGLLNLVFALASYYSLGKLKTPIIIGGVIGGGIMMSFSSFMTGVYWAQLSLCEAVTASIRHYSCDQKVAYRVTSFFSIIMFLLQVKDLILFS